jgi:hydrogenase nickel incorporation protein HypB
MSSPGAGKTTLLERTARDFRAVGELFVIEGDQATLRDAERVREAGARVAQVNTGAGCHLDANMVLAAARQLELPRGATLIIENVGNLVCPALFDLGERARVVVASATEGDEKPVKYPHMFRSADVVMINKVDLLPYVHFDTAAFVRQVLQLNPDATILEISAAHGSGLENWYQWLKQTKTIGI